MKQRRISAAGAVLAIIGLLFIGCNQLADGTEETVKKDPPAPSPSGPPTLVAGDLLGIPYTSLVQVNTSPARINGSGTDGAFIQNRRVRLSSYEIGKYEVTRELFVQVMSRLYDDLSNAGFFQKPGHASYAINNTSASGWALQSLKAAVFVEYMGSTIYGVGGDGQSVENAKRNTSQNQVFFMSDSEKISYFSDRYKPMGYLQFHEAIVFCNYLSILSGIMPVYKLYRYMTIDNQEKTAVVFGSDSDYKYGGVKAGSEGYRYIRPDLYLPLTAFNANTGGQWTAQTVQGEAVNSVKVRKGDHLTATGYYGNPRKAFVDEPWATDLMRKAASRNPVSWFMDAYWDRALPSAENKESPAVEKADSFATFPYKDGYEYSLRDVVKNCRFDPEAASTGFRAPSEVQWEFAARGGSTSDPEWNYTFSGSNKAYEGKEADKAEASANFSAQGPLAVGSLKGNRLGIHDMSGNLAEWVWDFKGGDRGSWKMHPISDSSVSEEFNPLWQYGKYNYNDSYQPVERVIRGGSWMDKGDNRNVLARMTRNMPVEGGNVRDGFIGRIYSNRTKIGTPGSTSAQAASQQGLRIARQYVNK